MTDAARIQTLLASLRSLAPWGTDPDFVAEDWRNYIKAARLVQNSEPADVKRGLAVFLDEPDDLTGVENETRLFLLMRVVFDLPDCSPVDQRRVFKGWVNWPPPDAEGNVSLSWPVDWQNGRPALLAPFAGADGPRYGAIDEYCFLHAHRPFRNLDAVAS